MPEIDKLTIERIKKLHPKLRKEAEKIYSEICERLTGNSICRFAMTLRTFAEQDALFNKVPKVTKARGGQSFHNYGLAIDIVLLVDQDGNGTFESASWNTKIDHDGDNMSDWMECVEVFEKYGWEWGGKWNFKDDPHFQKTFGYTWQDLLNKHKRGEVDKAGYVLI